VYEWTQCPKGTPAQVIAFCSSYVKSQAILVGYITLCCPC